MHASRLVVPALVLTLVAAAPAAADTRLRIMPPAGATFAVGQRFDLRVEATGDTTAPRGLTVLLDGRDITTRNSLAPGSNGELGFGGTGTAIDASALPAAPAPATSSNLLVRALSFATPGRHEVTARTADGATLTATYDVGAWQAPRAGQRPARNVIVLLGDGMGVAARTAARIVSKGQTLGKTNAPLAMDTLPVTGLVMTSSLNATITDSAPGMSSYATGHKANNNHVGVYPDNTPDHFDNPRVEYVGELLKRTRGRGFNVGLVTTASVIDATPAGNAVHTSFRDAYYDIATRLYDERATNGVTVLMGGGATYFSPVAKGGTRKDDRDLEQAYAKDGYAVIHTRTELKASLAGAPPKAVLGLFHPRHMSVAFDKVGAGTYSDELALERNKDLRDQPMLPEMASLALRGRLDRQAGARVGSRPHHLGHHRVRPDGAGGARLREGHQHRRRPRQRHPGRRHRRSRKRRLLHHRRRQRTLRAGGHRQVGARLRGDLPLRAGADAELLHQLHGGPRRLPRESRPHEEAAHRLRRRTGSSRELALEPARAGGHGGRSGQPHRGGEPAPRRPVGGIRQPGHRREGLSRIHGLGRDRERRHRLPRRRRLPRRHARQSGGHRRPHRQ